MGLFLARFFTSRPLVIRRLAMLLAAVLGANIPVGHGHIALASSVSVSASPSTINVCGSGNSSSVTASTNGGQTFSNPQPTATTNPTLLTLSNKAGAGSATYTLTATANASVATLPQSSTLTFTDTSGKPGNATITVVDPTVSSKSSLTFTNATPQTFTVSATGCSINITNIAFNSTDLSISPSSTPLALPQTFTVTPKTASTSNIVLTDTYGTAITVAVTISAGTLTVSPTSQTISAGGTGSITASETFFTGQITASPSPGPSIVTVSPASAAGPTPAPFTVTPTGTNFGTQNIIFSDGTHTATASVTVTGGTISVSGGTAATFTVNNNTNAHLAATSAPIEVQGSVQTTSAGAAAVAVQSPGDYTGTHGGPFPIANLSYQCTNHGGTGGAFDGGTPSKFEQLVASGNSNACWSLSANSFANIDFFLNLFLDDRALQADSYPVHSGFNVVLSAT